MQAETLVTAVILTNQFGSNLVKAVQSIPQDWVVLICSPSTRLPQAIDGLHPMIHHWQMLHQNIHDFAQMRNLALQRVKTKWAFFLDSDEVLEDFDQQQLQKLLNNQNIAGLTIARSDVFYGHKLRHGEAGRQSLTRLVRVNQSHFTGKVHEVAVVKGHIVNSDISISHFSHESISQFISQVSRYANMSTDLHQSKSIFRLLTELLLFPPLKFLLNYFFKLGFLDGWRGLAYALVMSLHSTLVRLMTLEQKVRHPKRVDRHTKYACPEARVVSVSSNSEIKDRLAMIQLGLGLGLLILLPFGQLLRWSITDSVAIYPHDVILSLLVLLFAIDIFRSKPSSIWRQIQPRRWEALIWGYFWLLGVIKLLIGKDPNQFLIISRLGVYTLGLLIVIKSLNHCPLRLNKSVLHARHFWVTTIALFAWLSFLLYLIFPDMRSLSIFGWDDHYYRLIGTLFDPNYSGLALITGILMTFGWLGLQHRFFPSINRLLSPILTFFFAICLGLTFSRSSWMSISIAITAYFLIKMLKNRLTCHPGLVPESSNCGVGHEQRKKRFLLREFVFVLASLLVMMVTVIVAPKPGGEGVDLTRSASVNSRLAFDQYLLQSLTASDWIFGNIVDQPFKGLSQLAKTNQPMTNPDQSTDSVVSFHPKTANNLWLTSLLWGGVIGLTLLILLFGKWFWQLSKSSPIAMSILIAWLVHAQFNNSFLEPFVFLFVGGSIFSLLASISQTKADK